MQNNIMPLQLLKVSFSYNTSPFINQLNLSVNNGEFIYQIGPNGSGKSTSLKIAADMLTPVRQYLTPRKKQINTKAKIEQNL